MKLSMSKMTREELEATIRTLMDNPGAGSCAELLEYINDYTNDMERLKDILSQSCKQAGHRGPTDDLPSTIAALQNSIMVESKYSSLAFKALSLPPNATVGDMKDALHEHNSKTANLTGQIEALERTIVNLLKGR